MNLGGALHIYAHLCAGLGLWMTLSSAPQSLNWLGILSLVLLPWSLVQGWQKQPLLLLPGWCLLLLIILTIWWQSITLVSLLGIISFLALYRLVTARRSRDYTQLIFISFAQVLFATTLEFEISFGLTLIIYMIGVTTLMTLNHLRGEIERSTLLDAHLGDQEQRERKLIKRLRSRRLIDRRFLFGVGLVAALLCIGAIMLFFMLPRIGGQWYQGYQVGPTRSGFSGDVTLGGVGEIQLDDRIAFRAVLRELEAYEPLELGGRLPDPQYEVDHSSKTGSKVGLNPLEPQDRYWVGRVLNHYENGRWRQLQPEHRMLRSDAVRWVTPYPRRHPEQRLIIQHFYIDARGHNTLFRLGDPLAISLPKGRPPVPIFVSRDHDLLYEWSGDLHYAVLSSLNHQPGRGQQSFGGYDGRHDITEFDQYKQVPQVLQEPLEKYAREVIQNERDPLKIAARLELHLKENFTYRLKQTPPKGSSPKDPVLRFLNETRSGHCEYFSSALVLLLRSLKIPARHITGYAGGEWSDIGEYYIVRQRDAHAWVEVWSGDPQRHAEDRSAWITFDPTPSRPQLSSSKGAVALFNQWRDRIQFYWFRYVLGFDAGDQVKAAQLTRRRVKQSWQNISTLTWLKSAMKSFADKSYLLNFTIPLLLIVTLIWGRVWVKRSEAIRIMINRLMLWLATHRLKKNYPKGEEAEYVEVWRKRAEREVSILYERALLWIEETGLEAPHNLPSEDYIQGLMKLDAEIAETFSRFYQHYLVLRFGEQASPDDLAHLRTELNDLKALLDSRSV